MQFNYGHAMDRDYIPMDEATYTATAQPLPHFEKEAKEPMFYVDEIGTSISDRGGFKANLQAAIRMGASQIEMSGSVYQGEGGVGADALTEEDRLELKEMAQVSGVELISVHVPSQQIGNLSGLGQNGFTEAQRHTEINEVKKQIEFAGDVTNGGAIVVHTGEFPRTMYDKYPEFELHPNEEMKAVHHLVDPRSGQVIKSVRGDEEIWRPMFMKDSSGERIPIRDKEGQVVVDKMTGEQMYQYERDDKDNIKVQIVRFDEFKKNPEFGNNVNKAALEFFKEQQTAEMNQVLGQAKEYETYYKRALERRGKLLDAYQDFKRRLKDVPEEDRWKHDVLVPDGRTYGNLIPPDVKDPLKYLEEEINENEKTISYGEQIALSGRKNAARIKQMMSEVQTIDQYGKENSVKSMAELGVFAMNETKDKKLKNPLFMSPENIFPEMGYGSHPDELIEYVKDSRDAMARKLQKEWGYDEKKAKEAAKKHIRATFDTEHLGLWKKHFKVKEGQTQQEADKAFNKWYMKQIKKLEDADIIGHVHMADGFGRGHANLPPGQGILPVKKAMEYLKEKGYKGTLISEGYATAGGQQRQLGDAWRYFGAHVGGHYGPTSDASSTWTDISNSYLGQNRAPYFVFGGYAPSQEYAGAPFWSGISLE